MAGLSAARLWYGGINGVAAGAFTLLAAALAFNLGSALGVSYYEEQAFAIEQKYGMQVMSSQDAAEGPRAFLEKRKPVFQGK